jgi:excinuclease UvrABC nuclease subunit
MIGVYTHHAKDGTLLYVGSSSNIFQRQIQHQAKAPPWFSQIAKTEIQIFDTIEKAKECEETLIRFYRPLYNITHNSVGIYTKHLIRLYTGDWERLKKFYPKPNRIIRALVNQHIQDFNKANKEAE